MVYARHWCDHRPGLVTWRIEIGQLARTDKKNIDDFKLNFRRLS